MKNEYYVLDPNSERPLPLDLNCPEETPTEVNLPYFARALRHAEEITSFPSGLTFYLVYGHFEELPSHGDDVVVLLLSDEACRLPLWLGKVRAVFRCIGTHPHLDERTSSLHLDALSTLRAARNAALWASDWAKARAKRAPSHRHTPQFIIPLGYGVQEDLTVKPMAEREIDVAFMGSVEHRSDGRESLQEWIRSPPGLKTPKVLARQQMVDAVESAQARLSDLNAHLKLTDSFQDSWSSDGKDYAKTLMNTKICLAPRGTTIDTGRYFEGLRYGCAVVTGPLPDRWFYRGGPAIELPGWEALPAVLEALLAGHDALELKHRESLHWWKHVCSEESLGRYMAEKLQEIRMVE